MHITLNKKKSSTSTSSNVTTCGKCNYQRKSTDTVPEWQCPCCKAAYTKVSTEYRKERKKKFDEKMVIETEQRGKKIAKQEGIKRSISAFGLGAMLLTRVTTCTAIVVSAPISIKIIGAGLIVGSIIYLMHTLSA